MTDREIISEAGNLLYEICNEYKRKILDYFDSDDLLAVIPDTEIVNYIIENDLMEDVTIIESPVSIMDELKQELLASLYERYDLTDIEEMERLFISSRNNIKTIL